MLSIIFAKFEMHFGIFSQVFRDFSTEQLIFESENLFAFVSELFLVTFNI